MGMLASDFHIEKQSFDDTDVNVLVHRRHEKKLAANKVLMDSLVRYVREAIYKLQQLEIDYPFEQFSIVEVPSFLTLLNRNRDVVPVWIRS